MASVTKRGDGYTIRISLYNEEGKRYTKNFTYKPKETGTKGKKEAKEYAIALEQKYRYDGARITFRQYVEDSWKPQWLSDHLAQSNKEHYEAILKDRIMPFIGDTPIADITKDQLQKMITSWKDDGLAPATIHKMYTVCNSVMQYAEDMDVIPQNKLRKLKDKLPAIKKDKKLHYFDIEQTKAFLKALTLQYPYEYGKRERKDSKGNTYTVEGYRSFREVPYQLQVYFTIAVYSGFRRGEMIALTWEDIDFQNRKIDINKAAAHTKEGQIIKEPKTEESYRYLTLPLICFLMLQQWKQQEMAMAEALGEAWQGYTGVEFDKNSIFIQADGKQMDLYTPYAEFRKIINNYNALLKNQAEEAHEKALKEGKTEAEATAKKKAIMDTQLPMIRLHDLRHTSATLMIASGVDIETVSERMGHSNTSVTVNVYGHALKEKDSSASDTLGKLLGGNSPEDDQSKDKNMLA